MMRSFKVILLSFSDLSDRSDFIGLDPLRLFCYHLVTFRIKSCHRMRSFKVILLSFSDLSDRSDAIG